MKPSKQFLQKYKIRETGRKNRFGDPYYYLSKDLLIFGKIIPAGFITDLATVPKLAQKVIPYKDDLCIVAILHDWHYTTHEVTRKEADKIMRDYFTVNTELGTIQKYAVWAIIRIFGSSSWNMIPEGPCAANLNFLSQNVFKNGKYIK